jgi:L-2-hydroxyglutarate oxidase LhgO
MRVLSAAARGRQLYDACVVGGGAVGLAVARELAVRGHSVLLLEKEASICAGAASSGNSGLVHTGYDAVPGSVESRLMRRSLAIRPAVFDAIGLDEHEHWRQAPGSLVLAWNEQERSALQAVMDETREAGDDDTRLLEPSELFALEPGLSRRALGGVLCPHETVTEPWLVCVALGANARQHSAELRQSTELVGAAFSAEDGLWTLRTRMTPLQPPGAVHCPGRSPLGERLAPPPRSDDEARPAYRPPIALEQWISGHAAAVEAAMPEDEFSARVVINCAGLFGDLVEAMRLGAAAAAGDGPAAAAAAAAAPRAAPPFTVTPRKGQFAVLRPADPEADAPRFVLEQIANEFTKGVIVWTTSKERARHARPGTRTRTRTRTRRARADLAVCK